MASIRETRKTLVPVIIVLSIIVVACFIYLMSPAGRSRDARQRDLDTLKEQLVAKRVEVLPTRGMDGKLKQASTDIGGFYKERFPAQYSTVTEELGKLAAASGVQIATVKYDDKDAPVEGLRTLQMEVALSGSYLQEVKFINALERDKLFFVIDGVTLGEQQGNVRLQLKLETYLHSGATT
jgi:type IV pilus assembly protein PilO